MIGLLADAPELVPAVGEMRWREWGHEPEREDMSWWVDTTSREAGRSDLPVTFVATDERGEAVGAVGLGQFDIEERQDRSPWVLGMIVRADRRDAGVGRSLLAHLEQWADERGIFEIWVATGGMAVDFYRSCGWVPTETIIRDSAEPMNVLVRRLP